MVFLKKRRISIVDIARKLNISIPEEIAVVGFSNNYGSTLIEPRLTTVAQPTHEIGQVAAQLLLDQINSDTSEWKPIYRVLKTELLVRGSS